MKVRRMSMTEGSQGCKKAEEEVKKAKEVIKEGCKSRIRVTEEKEGGKEGSQ